MPTSLGKGSGAADQARPDARHGLRRYLATWASLLRLCFHHQPVAATAAIVVRLAGVFTFAAVALAMRAAVDATGQGLLVAGVVAALGAATAYGIDLVVNVVSSELREQTVERVGLMQLERQLLHDVNDIEGTEHLERPEYLDRLAILRGSSWGLVDSAWAVVETAFHVVRLGVSLLLLSSVNPWLLSLLVFAVAPIWLDGRGRRAMVAAERRTAESLRVEKHVFELLTTAAPGKEIRLTNATEYLTSLLSRNWAAAHRVRFRAALASAGYRVAGWAVFTTGFGLSLAVVIIEALRLQSTPGDVVLAITVASNLRYAVNATVARSTQTAGYARLLEPYLWLRDYARAARHRATGDRLVPRRLRHGISLENVGFSYPGGGRPAVDALSVHLPAGTVVAVVGEYGSGKTTLVKLLTTLYRPQIGRILVDGEDLATLDTAAWRRATSVVFQDFGRYLTAFGEAVGVGEPSAIDDRDRITVALAEVGGLDLVERLPHGLDSQLGRQFGGIDLSEGQWQKVALARSCMRVSPLLLVLDEPTASLDAPSEHAIFEQYMTRARRLARRTGAVTIVVSHRFSTVAAADLILVMERGRLVEHGSHAELRDRGGSYARLYGQTAAAYSS